MNLSSSAHAAGTVEPSPTAGDLLSDRINAHTRIAHARLNRLILANFSKAFPPAAASPSTYVTGLAHIAQIYVVFEALWREELEKRRRDVTPCAPDDDATGDRVSDVAAAINDPSSASDPTHRLLESLYLPQLLRTERLRSDIAALGRISPAKVDQHLEQISSGGPLGRFVEHIRSTVRARPHTLLSYGWVMYMAIFSGGRYLRGFLEAQGREFWELPASVALVPMLSTVAGDRDAKLTPGKAPTTRHTKSGGSDPTLRSLPGLLFWNFPGDSDGVDLKTTFKDNFKAADTVLTPAEMDDVVSEAQEIFEHMLALVEGLERGLATKLSNAAPSSGNAAASYAETLLKGTEMFLRGIGRLQVTAKTSLGSINPEVAAGVPGDAAADRTV